VETGGDVQWPGSTEQQEDDNSYLSMWKRARARQEQERVREAREQNSSATLGRDVLDLPSQQETDQARREQQFAEILKVPAEERDRAEKLQVVTRAAAALAAAQALLADQQATPAPAPARARSTLTAGGLRKWVPTSSVEVNPPALLRHRPSSSADSAAGASFATELTLGSQATPGPDFWSWTPPPDGKTAYDTPQRAEVGFPKVPMPELLEKEKLLESLTLPLERNAIKMEEGLPLAFQSKATPSLPPLQSLLEVEKEKVGEQELQEKPVFKMPELDTETVTAVRQGIQSSGKETSGVYPDGSRWWQEKGTEYRANGVICNWTVRRGVSADESVEWEEKFWDAADSYDYKELGAEKSGRDSKGGVWREFWQEAMWQDSTTGLLHMEKSADKWAKNEVGGQWHEKWREHYDASGRAEKWADKWSQVDPNTPLEPGHAHVWHERWGEEYDGKGASMKYTDKWAERSEYGGGWTKWGDKWDERFDQQGCGKKQGETWWEGQQGERWNRTWGEGHNGTGWVHKYGKSSSGEHWDTHEQQDTWYERQPHYGFRECFDSSLELRRVGKKRRKKL